MSIHPPNSCPYLKKQIPFRTCVDTRVANSLNYFCECYSIALMLVRDSHSRVDDAHHNFFPSGLIFNRTLTMYSEDITLRPGRRIAGEFGPLLVLSCRVCLEEKPIKPLSCCKKAVCEECLRRYLSSQVQLGQADIKCPITECSEHLDETTVLYNLPHDDIIKYKYFLELSRIDSSTKPCPQCKHFTTFRRRGHIPTPAKLENKYKIQCPSCQFVWCFKCHSPWHEGVNCKEYKKGDKLLRHWANEIEHGQRNAQKCPKCKIHIQRTEGCDHMTCSQCNTNFCYRCGERYRQLRFFGDHTSNLSIFGCKYRYLPERPHLRRLVRGSVCAGKLLITPLILVLGLALGAVAVVVGLFVFPIYCLCKKQRKRSRTGMPW
ncbi:probable E3 ubiquitin-protein ligase RNF217 [Geospiza fortis]|uniref:E3 ubiquitin-protein ligase RNF217 n=1 Tax=Geospiza fortis TaxID=48883 RepID=A0A8N5F4A2_GEOFO|nr:probable E3 ubiquitin-protein ligase RNF217 [Geospiza fortis]